MTGEESERPAADDVAAVERDLAERGVPYARATVVRREPPVSANVGDRAVVTADGDLYGWVGGAACAQSVVVREAGDAIESGDPRLVGIAPDPETVDRPGLDAFPMRCHSEGVLEVFVEPVTPTTGLVVVGDSPVAQTLSRLAAELDFDVTLVVDDADADRDVPDSTTIVSTVDPDAVADAVGTAPLVVVASMGRYDARGIAAGVLADAPYVGLVASDERATEDTARAADLAGVDAETVRAAVTNPAGVDVAARSPPELAASLLAELVDVRAETGTGVTAAAPDAAERADADDPASDTADETESGEEPSGEAVDPVCGMTVDTADAAATVDHDGETYYFCCRGCADSFAADPGDYLGDGAEVEP
ncbi:MAG: XdhC family protein [Halobacterium sp.]